MPNPNILTSLNRPLRVAHVAAGDALGTVGVTLCPGKWQRTSISGTWQRDLATDIDTLQHWGAAAVVTLMPQHELQAVQADGIGAVCESRGIEWHHLPLQDVDVPDAAFETAWLYTGLRLREHLRAGRNVLLHCRGGLGRSGTIAARLLVELGWDAHAAIRAVRAQRPGAIETRAQETHVLQTQPVASDESHAARVLGCILGGAVGDAFGYAIEFDAWNTICRQHGPRGLREPVLQRGKLVVTDDTQMTLFTAEGILRAVVRAETRGICHAPGVVHHALLRWLKTQGEVPKFEIDTVGLVADPRLHHQRAPGLTCLSGLRSAKRFGDTARNHSKGCGTIMRVAPVALCSATSPRDLALETSALTHGHPTGQEAAAVFVDLLRAVARGVPLERAATEAITETHGETADALTHAVSAPRDGRAETVESLGGGWVAEEALAIAVYAALASDSFAAGLQIALCHSGDSDSTAAIAGNLLGLLYPAQVALHPAHDQIECADLINRIARDLALAEDPTMRHSDQFYGRYPGW